MTPAAWKVTSVDESGSPLVYVTDSWAAAEAARTYALSRGRTVRVEALVSLPVVLDAIKAALQENAR